MKDPAINILFFIIAIGVVAFICYLTYDLIHYNGRSKK